MNNYLFYFNLIILIFYYKSSFAQETKNEDPVENEHKIVEHGNEHLKSMLFHL